MKLILLGAPGVGKGTQGKMLQGKFKIPQISTGDILRKAVSNQTTLGIEAKSYMDKGELVPDSLVVSIINDRLKEADCREGFILDGFPRNIEQAEELNKVTEIDYVINIIVPFKEIVSRLTGRRVCKNCGEAYHLIYNPPQEEDICDRCKSELYQRNDDQEETVKERLKVYEAQTAPLIDYYKSVCHTC